MFHRVGGSDFQKSSKKNNNMSNNYYEEDNNEEEAWLRMVLASSVDPSDCIGCEEVEGNFLVYVFEGIEDKFMPKIKKDFDGGIFRR